MLENLTRQIVEFRDERDWAQFHKPKNLVAALSVEAAELQELWLWKSTSEVEAHLNSEAGREQFSDELADVLIYTLLLASTTDIDLEAAVESKLAKNRAKYPVDLARGRSLKYDELEEL